MYSLYVSIVLAPKRSQALMMTMTSLSKRPRIQYSKPTRLPGILSLFHVLPHDAACSSEACAFVILSIYLSSTTYWIFRTRLHVHLKKWTLKF